MTGLNGAQDVENLPAVLLSVCLSVTPSNCEENDTVRWEPSLEVVANKDRGSEPVFTALWAAA